MGALAAVSACRSLPAAEVPAARRVSVAQVAIDAALRLDQPLTLSLRLEPAQRAALHDAGEARHRWSLRVEGLAAPQADVGLHVYISLPNEAPRLDREHRAGAFAFYPSGDGAAAFVVDAGAVLGRLRERAAAGETWELLTVTLVLVPLRNEAEHAEARGIAAGGARVRLTLE